MVVSDADPLLMAEWRARASASVVKETRRGYLVSTVEGAFAVLGRERITFVGLNTVKGRVSIRHALPQTVLTALPNLLPGRPLSQVVDLEGFVFDPDATIRRALVDGPYLYLFVGRIWLESGRVAVASQQTRSSAKTCPDAAGQTALPAGPEQTPARPLVVDTRLHRAPTSWRRKPEIISVRPM